MATESKTKSQEPTNDKPKSVKSSPNTQPDSEPKPNVPDSSQPKSQKSSAKKSNEHVINLEQFADDPFKVPANRRKFIQRVFIIVTAMLFISTMISLLGLVWEGFRIYNYNNWWPYVLAVISFLAVYFIIACIPFVRHKVPLNYFMLLLYSVVTGIMLAIMVCHHSAWSFSIAAGMTTVLCIAIVLYATFTKTDFTGCFIFVFVFAIVLLMSFIIVILAFFLFPEALPILHVIICCIIVLGYSFMLIIDIQMVLGNKKNRLALNEYAAGALYIYTDVIEIFMGMLGLSR
uniref:Protein lifeguard 2 n=1 Tax=Panagrellus redivivus TaxID=6233 RepID=A0A7E4VPH1_PANRE